MSAPVPLGQFVPGDSAVHALEARAKIAVAVAFTVALFLVHSWMGLVVLFALTLVVTAGSRVPVRIVARGARPVLWLLLFTVLANALRWNPSVALLRVGPLGVDGPGLARGLFFGVRVLALVIGTSLVTLTTSPVALTDGLSSLMRPLERIGFPAEDAAMMLSIALRFIPTTAEEAERIVVAQTARGARFDEGGVLRRARAWVPVLIPLFVRLFRRADDLAIAMESRCYTGQGRTRLRESVMRRSDWLTVIVSVCLAAGVAVFL